MLAVVDTSQEEEDKEKLGVRLQSEMLGSRDFVFQSVDEL